ncbi:conserved hypothetical protein [Leishmania infantum JPCM5]|uniref:Uncharacterized protein n=2 Tax=Leishmania infantum TaxID=5671 RepID=E9AG38_LEIIN|nr:conserved hypothetical protein [Leishmania infantum JPCM5]CAC9439275.1 hypothetical_protein_-_conserved [Leishmania infantum]CBZ08322.1 conserved hypothetical protein [Leishmania infantum JPCM5]SUZ38744.1 hypothetical_protein_-_conserved [Leishmania infantum]|eukprot:XP_003392190.1 conserved hypothetical protein [Leishmania infantum JPCM5]
MEVCGQTRVAATASNAVQVDVVAAVHADSTTPRARRDEGKESCSNSHISDQCAQPPYTRRSGGSSSADGDGSALEKRADGKDDVEEDEEDIVVDELDLYCSTPALLYQSPVTDITWSDVAADLYRFSAKAAVSTAPPGGRRAVAAWPSACASLSSASSTASCQPCGRDTSVDESHHRDEGEPSGERSVVSDEEGSEAGDRHVAGAPSHPQTAASACLHGADDAEPTSSSEGCNAAAPIVSSSRDNDAGSGHSDGVAGQARASVEAKAKRSDKRDDYGGNTDAGVCSPTLSPSRPASACASSPSSARRQGWSVESDHGRGGGEHGAGDHGSSGGVASMSQGVAAKSTPTATFDAQAPPAPLLRSSAAVTAATSPPARQALEAEDGPYMPPLMDELDGELLQLIKAYYMRKQSAAAAATPLYPPPPSHAAASSSSTFASTCCACHAFNRMKSRCSSGSADGSGGSTLAETAAATEKRGSGSGSDALHDSRRPLLSTDGRRAPSGLLRDPFTAPHAAGTAAALGKASERGPQELRGRHPGDCPSSYVIGPSDDAARDSAAAAGLRLGENVLHRPPYRGMSRVRVHGDSTCVGFGAAAATVTAASFSPQQHTFTTAATLYNPMTLGEASRGQHRAAAASGAATLAEGAATLHHQTHSGTNISGGGGAGGALSGGIASGLSALSSLPSYSSTSFVRAYVSDMSLSLEPAIIVSALTAAFNIIVVYFLQQHVLDTRDHLGLFLIGSYMIFASYYMIYYFLERFSDSFRRIASQDKKFYIIGNLIKAGILISITPFACVHLVKIIVFEEWESNILRNLGCIYTIPDFISMVIVRRMRWSTWIHHACVVLFNYFSIMNNYQHENVCRCVVVYAAFSSFAYCVNVLLASRFLGVSVNVARVLSFVALVVYALCCAVNWAWQVYYLRRLLISGHDHWTVYVYMLLISLVMWDDIVLNSWLLHHARNNAYVASQHLQQQQQQRTRQQQQQSSPASTRMTSARVSQRPSSLYRSQDTRAVYMAPPLPPAGLPPRAP